MVTRVCHGRLVFDICLDEPKIRKSQYAQMKEALVEEVQKTNEDPVRPNDL